MGKTIRFGDLVRASGQPEPVALWQAPEKDKSFMRAVKENKVLTVIQEPRAKTKDYGLIGFHQHSHASYFIFPRRLTAKGDNVRVVGINYQLVQQPKMRMRLAEEKV